MEKAVLNLSKLNVTQGMNGSYSHKGCLAIDIAGHGDFKAPFTGTIKKIYTKDANQVWLESNEKVLYADGTIDYMTLSIWHDNDVSNLKVGQVIKQGQVFYQEGTKGQVTGKHNHLTVGKGKFTGSGWYKNTPSWCINNQYDITKALFVYKDTHITKNGGYNWNITNDFTKYEAPIKSIDELAIEVIEGKWGNGDERKKRLAEAGYDYSAVQSMVNQKLSGGNHAPQNRYYTVVRGDTLWGIAQKFYGNGSRYTEIARANNIANPDIIHVGQKLLIP